MLLNILHRKNERIKLSFWNTVILIMIVIKRCRTFATVISCIITQIWQSMMIQSLETPVCSGWCHKSDKCHIPKLLESSICSIWCRRKFDFCEKHLPQVLHVYGFSPVWLLKCLVRCSRRLKILLQYWHFFVWSQVSIQRSDSIAERPNADRSEKKKSVKCENKAVTCYFSVRLVWCLLRSEVAQLRVILLCNSRRRCFILFKETKHAERNAQFI